MDTRAESRAEARALSQSFGAEPVISVLIPAHGRPEKLGNCLQALSRQDLPSELYEVIVCDDGSTVPLEEQLAPMLAALSMRMRVVVVRQVQAGPAAARNHAASVSHGRFVAFTDDDCLPATDWLATLVAYLERIPGVLIGGGLKNAVPENVWSTATHLIMDCAYQYPHRAGAPRFFSTSNMAMFADGFRALGGFSETFRLAAGEDYDFSARWQHHGWPAQHVPEAVVYHAHSLTFRRFARQHLNYGRGLFRMRQMMARRSGVAMQASRPGFYLSLVIHAFQHGEGVRGFMYAGLVMLSQVATLAGASYEAILVGGAAPRDPEPLPSPGRTQE